MYRNRELIYLVAPTGLPNFGDEFIAAAWLRTLARRRPSARVILDCRTPGSVAVLHAGLHPNLTVTDTLFRLCDEARREADPQSAHFDEVVRIAEEGMRNPEAVPHLESGLRLAQAADVVHVLGGGWFNDMWPEHAGVVAAASVAGESEALRVMTGIGLLPGAETAKRLREVWPRFDRIDLRDEGSTELVKQYVGESLAERCAVTCTGDDAWTVLGGADLEDNGLGFGTEAARERNVVVCLQSDLLKESAAEAESDPVTDLARATIRILQSWGVRGSDIAVVEAIPEVDSLVWTRVAELAREHAPELVDDVLMVRFFELWNHGLPVRAGQKWLSTRFHPHLIAAARGAHGVALDAHVENYYTVKHGLVTAAGSQWTVADPYAEAETDILPGQGMSAEAVERARELKLATIDAVYPMSRVQEKTLNTAVRARRLARRALTRR